MKDLNEVLHLKSGLNFMTAFDEKECIDNHQACTDCGLKNTVYGAAFYDTRTKQIVIKAYCYSCLVKHCKAIGAIPYPIREDLYDKLKRDTGIGQERREIHGA